MKDTRGQAKAEREFHRRFENRHKAAPVTCAACGRRVSRKARQQRYCSDRCRQYALRENKARTAIKNAPGYQDTGPVTNPPFLANKNNDLQGAKSGSSMPLNVLGGHRWPNATAVDRDLLRKIVRAEIGVIRGEQKTGSSK